MTSKNVQKACDAVLENIAQNMLTLRAAKTLTRRDLANKSGVNEDVLMKIEMRQRLPRVETLVRVAHALDVDIYKLFTVRA